MCGNKRKPIHGCRVEVKALVSMGVKANHQTRSVSTIVLKKCARAVPRHDQYHSITDPPY